MSGAASRIKAWCGYPFWNGVEAFATTAQWIRETLTKNLLKAAAGRPVVWPSVIEVAVRGERRPSVTYVVEAEVVDG